MRMSGLNFSNISGAFAGAGQALSQGVDIKAKQQLAEMMAMRQENLQRFLLQKQLQHEDFMLGKQQQFEGWKTQYGGQIQSDIAARGFAEETMREKAAQERQLSAQEYGYNRWQAMSEAGLKREGMREDAGAKLESQRLIAQNRDQMRHALEDHYKETTALQSQIRLAAGGSTNPDIVAAATPEARMAAMRSDPTIGPLMQQLDQMNQEHDRTMGMYHVYADQLGDPVYAGHSAAPVNFMGTQGGGGATPAFDTSGGAARTPNNPMDQQVPLSTSDDAANNTPAVGGAPPMMPGGSGALRSPFGPISTPGGQPSTTPGAGPLSAMPPPRTTMVGPLKSSPQLIPGRAAVPGMPQFGPPSQFGGQQQQAPSLIPPNAGY